MLLKITDGQALDERRLMDVYAESNLENTDFFCPEEPDKEAAVRMVESGFLDFLKNEFFKEPEVLDAMKAEGPFRLCDCVGKKNAASLKAHEKCGFRIVSEKGCDYLHREADDRDFGLEYRYERP